MADWQTGNGGSPPQVCECRFEVKRDNQNVWVPIVLLVFLVSLVVLWLVRNVQITEINIYGGNKRVKEDPVKTWLKREYVVSLFSFDELPSTMIQKYKCLPSPSTVLYPDWEKSLDERKQMIKFIKVVAILNNDSQEMVEDFIRRFVEAGFEDFELFIVAVICHPLLALYLEPYVNLPTTNSSPQEIVFWGLVQYKLGRDRSNLIYRDMLRKMKWPTDDLLPDGTCYKNQKVASGDFLWANDLINVICLIEPSLFNNSILDLSIHLRKIFNHQSIPYDPVFPEMKIGTGPSVTRIRLMPFSGYMRVDTPWRRFSFIRAYDFDELNLNRFIQQTDKATSTFGQIEPLNVNSFDRVTPWYMFHHNNTGIFNQRYRLNNTIEIDETIVIVYEAYRVQISVSVIIKNESENDLQFKGLNDSIFWVDSGKKECIVTKFELDDYSAGKTENATNDPPNLIPSDYQIEPCSYDETILRFMGTPIAVHSKRTRKFINVIDSTGKAIGFQWDSEANQFVHTKALSLWKTS